MFKKGEGFLNILKTNKKLFYTFCVFVALVILLIVINIDTPTSSKVSGINKIKNADNNNVQDDYAKQIEAKLDNILGRIDGVKSVKSMVYTKSSCKVEPIYDETINTETNTETGTNGLKKENSRNNTQKQVKLGADEEALEKYYEYPEIEGVLVVVDYSGKKNIYNIMMKSIEVLLDVDLNKIEIIVSNK